MTIIVINAIFGWLQSVANGTVDILAKVLVGIANGALVIAQQPWVAQATQVSVAVAAAVFTFRIAYEALSRYVLWNEGTADADGGQIWKGMLRVMLFGAFGTYLAYNMFQFGIWFGGALVAAPLADAVTATQGALPHLMSLPGMAVNDLFVIIVSVLVAIVCLIIVTIQMAVRGVELIFFVVAAPIVALGQFSPDGGVWNSWWRSLVVLSLSQTVQFLGIKAIVGSMQIITSPNGSLAAALLAVLDPTILGLVALFFAVSAGIATVKGPHLMREWSYRTGVGAGIFQGATFAGQTIGRQAISNWMKR